MQGLSLAQAPCYLIAPDSSSSSSISHPTSQRSAKTAAAGPSQQRPPQQGAVSKSCVPRQSCGGHGQVIGRAASL